MALYRRPRRYGLGYAAAPFIAAAAYGASRSFGSRAAGSAYRMLTGAGAGVAPPRRSAPRSIPRGVRTVVRSRGGRADLGYLDTAFSAVSADTTGVVTLLNGSVPGTGATTRIGRKIRIRSLQYKFYTYGKSTANSQLLRISFVWDRQCNGAAPAITDIYDQVSGANAPWGPINIDNSRRFRVIHTEDILLTGSGSGATTGLDGAARSISGYRKMNHMTIYNSGSAGTVADIETGGLFAVIVGSAPTGTTAANVYGIVRVRYDMLP